MRYCESAGLDPEENLALEERLFESFDAEPILYLWQNGPCIVLGKNQLAEEEADLPLAAARGVPIVRRATGGGAVYQDEGNLNFTVITADRPGASPYELALQPAIDALLPFGLNVVYNGRNDLCIDGRKISGCASRVRGDRLLLHATLLIHTDLDALDALLTPPADKLERNGVASVRSRVANLTEFCPELTVPEVKAALRRHFSEYFLSREKGTDL